MTETTPLEREDVASMFLNASNLYSRASAEDLDRQRLLIILQNNEYWGVLPTLMCEHDVLKAFHTASSNDDVELLQAFIHVGMDVNERTEGGVSALKCASVNKKEKSVRWLLDHDAIVDIRDVNGLTPLISASWSGSVSIVEMLLLKNACVDCQIKVGYTALMIACLEGHIDIVQLLLNHNANIDVKSKGGKTALDMAKKEEIKELLQNHVTANYFLK